MKKNIAKILVLSLLLSTAVVFSPGSLLGNVDVVSAATQYTQTQTPSTPAIVTETKAPSNEAGQGYVVKVGDVLWKIANKFNTTWKKLAELNQLKNPNLIYPGQKIWFSGTQAVAVNSLFKAGTYTASANGLNGPVKVEVVFSADKIQSVTIKEHKETAGLADPAFEKIPANIVKTQSLDVDVVSGATYVSKAIKYAVADTVKQAGGVNNPLLKVDLDRANASEEFFHAAVKAIGKPKAVNGVFEINSYDELKKALGYYAYIVYPVTKEGKFIYVDGSAVKGDTIKLMSDLTAQGEKANPKNADGSDKADVVTGATVLVTDNVTIDGNGKTIHGNGYPTFMFTGKMEDFGNDAVVADMKNITIREAAYTAKIGGAVFVAGAATLNLSDSTFANNTAKSARLAFNGGAAVYVNSEGLTPDVGRAVLNVKNTTFTGNSIANGAGAAVAGLNGDINIYNSTFKGNKSLSPAGSGGAVAMRSTSNLLIDGCTITENEATIAGGGVYIFDGESPQKPGAIMSSTVNAVIKNSTIKGNIAPTAADVAYGRYYSDTYKGDRTRNGLNLSEGNVIGNFADITFLDLERSQVKK